MKYPRLQSSQVVHFKLCSLQIRRLLVLFFFLFLILLLPGDFVPGIFNTHGIWKRGDKIEARVFDGKKVTGQWGVGVISAVRTAGGSTKYDVRYESGTAASRLEARFIRKAQTVFSLAEFCSRLRRSLRPDRPFVPGHCFYAATGACIHKSAPETRLICADIIESDPRIAKGLQIEVRDGVEHGPLIQIYDEALDRFIGKFPLAERNVWAYRARRIEMHRTIDAGFSTDDHWYWNDDLDSFALAFKHGSLLILKDQPAQV